MKALTVTAILTLVLSGALAPSAPAQGVVDRLLGDDPSAEVSAQFLVENRIYAYDAQGSLENFPPSEMVEGAHVLVVLTANTAVPSFVLRLESGAECVTAAQSLTAVHGGRMAYCHPVGFGG